jgi:hypothetical protein
MNVQPKGKLCLLPLHGEIPLQHVARRRVGTNPKPQNVLEQVPVLTKGRDSLV